ncbi:uncharacterized protein EI97DRAFT_441131 [Westerdykella ornata]|uniref:Uncharacterized protein n=1 Tax=Westerdykella ornata TaxID=318751 RepID=A0A6A6JML7_WESOR|nr:uncharacterized protein EI97DRAFT_441131 [Westerdykella ornata]KAF2277841.1 hypothetical protein EI97DRAFT_441131 [Westerdykella ornata]
MTTTSPIGLAPIRTTTASISTTTYQPCTWRGHCLGAACFTNEDCDNDWVCRNKVCSPCCESDVASPSSTSVSPTATLPATGDHLNQLGTAGAVGIGIGIVALVSATIGIACWLWRRRRRKPSIRSAPSLTSTTPSSLQRPRSASDDRKRLIGRRSHGELELDAPQKPGELESIELLELEGNHEWPIPNSTYKPPIVVPQRTVARQRYRFEEYEISPEALTRGELSFSPVSALTPEGTFVNLGRIQNMGDVDAEQLPALDNRGRGDASHSSHSLSRWPNTIYSSSSDTPR